MIKTYMHLVDVHWVYLNRFMLNNLKFQLLSVFICWNLLNYQLMDYSTLRNIQLLVKIHLIWPTVQLLSIQEDIFVG